MYSVLISEPAAHDLDSSLAYFLGVVKAPKAAFDLLDEIEHKLEFLGSNPLVYEIEHDDFLRKQKIRSVRVQNHLIFYIADQEKEEVHVLRILYARRNWLKGTAKNRSFLRSTLM